MKKVILPLLFALFSLSTIPGFAQVDWQLRTSVGPVTFDDSGNIDVGNGIVTLTKNAEGRLEYVAESEVFAINKNLDVIMQIPGEVTEANLQFVLRKPTSLVSSDVTGTWILQEFTVIGNENQETPNVSGNSRSVELMANGDVIVDESLVGTYSVDSDLHIVVDSGGLDTSIFGINHSKDIMISMSGENENEDDEYKFIVLTRLNADATDVNMADPWTWFGFDIDDLDTDSPSFTFASGPIVFNANGTYLITDDEGTQSSGTHSAGLDGIFTLFATEEGESDNEAFISQSRSFMSKLQSDESITQITMFQRDAGSYTLADLQGEWESYSFFIRELPNIRSQDFEYTFDWGNPTPDDVVINFSTQENVNYEIQRSTLLNDWVPVLSVLGDGTDQSIVIPWTDYFADQDNAFFRIALSVGD